MGQIDTKCENYDTFSDQISADYWILIWKNPGIIPFCGHLTRIRQNQPSLNNEKEQSLHSTPGLPEHTSGLPEVGDVTVATGDGRRFLQLVSVGLDHQGLSTPPGRREVLVTPVTQSATLAGAAALSLRELVAGGESRTC